MFGDSHGGSCQEERSLGGRKKFMIEHVEYKKIPDP